MLIILKLLVVLAVLVLPLHKPRKKMGAYKNDTVKSHFVVGPDGGISHDDVREGHDSRYGE